MLKNPAYFHFNLTAVSVAFISAAFGFRVFQIGFGTPNFPRHLIEMEFDAKKHSPSIVYSNERSPLVIHMYTDIYQENIVTHPLIRSCRENPQF